MIKSKFGRLLVIGLLISFFGFSTSVSAEWSGTTQAIQQKLLELGFDTGTPDGISGKRTREAIRAYQKVNGLPVDGWVVPESLLSKMNSPNHQSQVVAQTSTKKSVPPSYAAKETINATHKYVLGDNDSRNDGRHMAFLEAKRKVTGDTLWVASVCEYGNGVIDCLL
jgi:peptidoglycan hydrolase-like protein with peptidoglycan-binding domain